MRGRSKSPIKMTHRIFSLPCLSDIQNFAATNFSVLFILFFEHAL